MSSDRVVTTTAFETTTLAQPSFDMLAALFSQKFLEYLNSLGQVPGGQIVLRYIKSSYKNDPIRSLFELALVIFALRYFLSSKKNENKSDIIDFTPKEVAALCDEWEPGPLVEEVSPLERWQLNSVPLIRKHDQLHVLVLGKADQAVNLTSYDFLGLTNNKNIRDAAKETIRDCGVGACGPPNFYGTQDVHVRLEEDLATFLDAERGLLYGQDFVTNGSVIPVFLKRGDLCVVDSGVNLSIQKALIVSRCDIEFFDHNNMESLERLLEELKPVLDKQKPLRRRFIVSEGLFSNSGDVIPLPEIVSLKNKFKYRLFLDESFSVGILGKTGKGVPEHFGIPRSEISITVGSLARSFASSGGFCVGSVPMIHHQKISSLAYVFSAALPPYCASVASSAIKQITGSVDEKGHSKFISSLQERISYIHNALCKQLPSKFLRVTSSEMSPIIHIALSESYREQLNLPLYYGSANFLVTGKKASKGNQFSHKYNVESFLLQKIIDKVLLDAGILITRSKDILEHENSPLEGPQLLLMINNSVPFEVLDKVVNALATFSENVLSHIDNENDLFRLEKELIEYE